MKRAAVRALVLLLLGATSACSTYTGTGVALEPTAFERERGWIAVEGVPLYRQSDELDCGPTALAMVLAYYEPHAARSVLAELPKDRRIAVSELRDLAKRHGFSAYVVEGKPQDLVYELSHGRPVIVGMAKPTLRSAVAHYEVVIGLHRDTQRVATLDPALGYRQNSFAGFLSEWQGSGRVLLVIVPKTAKNVANSQARAAR